MSTPHEITQTLYERIESYLLKSMSAQEVIEFEKEMNAQPSLRKEVEIQKEILTAVELGALKECLQSLRKSQYRNDSPTSEKQSRRYWFALAAGMAAIVALGIWILIKPPTQEDLFAQYVEYDPGLPVPMSTTESYEFYDAMVDYKNELYEKAIDKWTALLNNDPKNDTLNYYIGAAHFNHGQYKQAIPHFNRVQALNSLEFQSKSQWYLALSWLQTENYAAIDSLSKQALPPYRKRINQLNNALKESQ